MESGISKGNGKVILMKFINRAYVQSHRDILFVFGDNIAKRGYAGQARQMRDEPNSVGIPTKWAPSRDPGAYFKDDDWDKDTVSERIEEAFNRLEAHLLEGKNVVIPFKGIGTGLAWRPGGAPALFQHITDRLVYLIRTYPGKPHDLQPPPNQSGTTDNG